MGIQEISKPKDKKQKEAAIYMIEKLDITYFSDSNENIFKLTRFRNQPDYDFRNKPWENSARIDNQGKTSNKM